MVNFTFYFLYTTNAIQKRLFTQVQLFLLSIISQVKLKRVMYFLTPCS